MKKKFVRAFIPSLTVTASMIASLGVLAACGAGQKPMTTSLNDGATRKNESLSNLENTRSVRDAPAGGGTLAALAAKTPELSVLLGLVKACGLDAPLADSAQQLTVFAPTNKAFESFLQGQPLPPTCTADVKSILGYHVVTAKVPSGALQENQAVPTLLGRKDELFIGKNDSQITINGSTRVVRPDVFASNGVVHIVDKVLLPDAIGTVVDAASKRFDFSTLVSKVVQAQLATALAEANGVTVFAPKNAAFTKLTDVPDGETLVRVLKAHVVNGRILARDLNQGLQKVTSLNGDFVSIFVSGSHPIRIWGSGERFAGSGRVVATDLITRNGVIQVGS